MLGWGQVWPWLLAIFLAGYLLGSIPFGVLVSRAFGLGDLRRIGSGNIGATNVLRTGNKGAAALTLVLDGAKGAVAVLIAAELYGGLAAQIAALGAFIGHLYPVWLRFRGGKGVATFLGLMLALHWPAGLAACLAWLATAFLSRISSLSALVAAALAPVWLWLTGAEPLIWLAVLLGVLIFARHGANIARLVRGEEPRIGDRG
ncbi:MAG: glycerol-3-phosphate 1-O-acyltransferase PlsY [Rubricella sp.]